MHLRRLHLTNFRQHANTELRFEPGLTGIVGPNGVGKTTLLEAIAWAMYGTPAARGTRDSIRRHGAPARSRVEVELEFGLGAHHYRLVRSLQGAELYQDGDPTPVANSLGAVTERINRLLGMTREEFFNTYFTGQKELAIMASMSAPERAQFLSRVLGYERLRLAQVRLKEERAAHRAALAAAEQGLVDLATLVAEEAAAADRLAKAEADLARLKDHLARAAGQAATLAPEWQQAQALQEDVRSLESDLRVAEHRATEAKRSVGELDRELIDALAAKAKYDELLPALAPRQALLARAEVLDGQAQAFAGRRALEAQTVEVTNAVAHADKRLRQLADPARLEVERGKLMALQTERDRLEQGVEGRRTAWVRDTQDAETQRKNLLAQYKDLTTQRAKLEETGPVSICPTCGRPLGAGFQAVLDLLTEQVEEVKLQGNYYKQRLEQLAREPADLVEARAGLEKVTADTKRLTGSVARLETEVGDRDRVTREREALQIRLTELSRELAATPSSYDEAEHKAVRQQLALLEPIWAEVVRLRAAAERAALLVPKAAEAERHLSATEAQVALLRGRLEQMGWSAERFEQLRARVQAAERERQVAEVAAARGEAELAAGREHHAGVARRRHERDERAREVARLEDQVLESQELDRAFTDLRDELNAALRPDLSEHASILLRDLTGGRYTDLELDEDYVATIVDDGEPKTVISGGEEDIANLALRLAISQMIADRAGQPFSLLILDEIFGSLDEDRRGAVIDLLRSLADRFPQVVLITHIESVRESFDRVIRIVYDVERGIATARDEYGSEVPGAAA